MIEAKRNGGPARAGSGGAEKGGAALIETVRMAEDYLKRRGVDSPRLSAELLLAKVLGCGRLDLYMRFDERLGEEDLGGYRTVLKRRADHYPLQYLIGSVEFYSLPFAVREGVFIPRPETELLVEWVEEAFDGERGARFIEFGVGSGVIAGSLARRHPGWRGFAFDKSKEAVALSKENLERLEIGKERVSVFAADGFEAVSAAGAFDLLVANPPYIPTGSIGALQREVSLYENRAALDGGADGLSFYPLLAASGRRILRPGGMIALEIGDGQGGRVFRILEEAGFERIDVRKDYNGRERLAAAFIPVSRGA
ncbi:MAG TPA: peptide chain release factor N(5)-glutamine methyltransferase [Candidatus Eisenbacteria bacterium]|uniref:Release factor glutamine methyltransferase n=1 Tax=Eiseniibacteriota bacterium TaxID=2212470 RepID=A0A7V2AVS0_UNCEI|nr:peptide chain release factor N(5)-glutamine methyltransferase [Candidatus Eisenbacteria bacterium]